MKNLQPYQTAPATNKAFKFWNIVESDLDSATLTFYGEVVESRPVDFWTGEQIDGLFICQDEFLKDLETLKNKKTITIKLNSGGGDLFTGVAIHNALKSLPAQKNVIVEGLAASAASVIACAGDTVQVFPGSVFMVHPVSLTLWESVNLKDLHNLQVMLEACERAVAEIYASKTGLTADECQNLITAETWMTGKEAVEKGFANELIDGEVQMSANSKYLFVNGIKKMSLTGHQIPSVFNILKAEETTPGECLESNSTEETENTEEKEQNEMDKLENLEQLRNAYPELCKQLENQAKSQAIVVERNRLKDIEAIENTIGDKALIEAAKFGEKPMNAKDLAFIAMKKQAEMGAAMAAAIKEDIQNSNADQVQASAPAETEDGQREAEATAALTRVVNIAKQMK